MTIAFPYWICGLMVFAIGATVGSFVNVAVYHIPWQKSVIWPGSTCPKCLRPIAATDNIPIFGWLRLGGQCRSCGLPIAPRYPLVEALVALLFVAAYLADVVLAPIRILDFDDVFRLGYHLVLVTFLVIATFIDYDYQIVPDGVTVPGMILGLGLAALWPGVRPEPSTAATAWEALKVGGLGLIVGGGLVWGVRVVAGLVLRREAMGFGDVTLLAMIGSYLGWQAAILTFFLAPFFGFAHMGLKLVRLAQKRLFGLKISAADRELPFGPYLSLAALSLLLAWAWIWPSNPAAAGWAKSLFQSLREVALLLSGQDL